METNLPTELKEYKEIMLKIFGYHSGIQRGLSKYKLIYEKDPYFLNSIYIVALEERDHYLSMWHDILKEHDLAVASGRKDIDPPLKPENFPGYNQAISLIECIEQLDESYTINKIEQSDAKEEMEDDINAQKDAYVIIRAILSELGLIEMKITNRKESWSNAAKLFNQIYGKEKTKMFTENSPSIYSHYWMKGEGKGYGLKAYEEERWNLDCKNPEKAIKRIRIAIQMAKENKGGWIPENHKYKLLLILEDYNTKQNTQTETQKFKRDAF